MPDPLLWIDRLRLELPGRSGTPPAPLLRDVSLRLAGGEVLGLVGESGSGKSLTALALMGLLDAGARLRAERLDFDGQDLLRMPERRRAALRGRAMAMVFQDPMSSLNPAFSIGWQLDEALRLQRGGTRRERRAQAEDLLRQVGIADPRQRLRAWPHHLSGGMCQRVMIAMALAGRPRLLIADEPTTALDVTIQAQIVDLLLELQGRTGMGLLFISHDLALVGQCAATVVVLYAGEVVESGPTGQVLQRPRHPYTAALLAALPERCDGARRLRALPGMVPAAGIDLPGCRFAARCPRAREVCAHVPPLLGGDPGQPARCHFPLHGSAPDAAGAAAVPVVTGAPTGAARR